VAEWLAHATNGATAELANVTRDAGDPSPTVIAGVLDETRSAIVAQGQIPEDQATPFLLVWHLQDIQWGEENQAGQDAQGCEIGVAYVDRDSNAERALRDAGYYLRAVKRSLNRFHRNENTAGARTRNSVILRNGGLAMRMTRPELQLQDAFISRVIAVTYPLRDSAP